MRVEEHGPPRDEIPEVDVGASVVMPGLVDTHVHINEPGRTDWEGFETATRAAAAGGVTTLFDMPLNSTPATTTVEALLAKRDVIAGKCSVDVGFLGGVVPGNTSELPALWNAGVFAFKCFLVHSGVDDFPNVTEADLRTAMPVLSELGATLMVHAELPGPIDAAARDPGFEAQSMRAYGAYLRSRPRTAEYDAIELMTRLCREFGTRVHIVHLSSADALPLLSRARDDGLPVSVETCPHYLTFAAEDIPDGATEFKCAPPLRERENRERLWRALGSGLIDMIVSDHSPCPPAMKHFASGDFARAWGGIASLQLGLSAVWKGANERGYSLNQLAEWMSHAPARLVGVDSKIGTIANGSEATFVVWNPEAEIRVEAHTLHQRHKITPYDRMNLRGFVQSTWLRGERVFQSGERSLAVRGEARTRGDTERPDASSA